jgi:hypothetical protein
VNTQDKINQIRNLIVKGRLEKAFDNIQNLAREISDKEVKKNIYLCSSNFHDSFNQQLLNLDNDKVTKKRAIAMLLEILDNIEEDLEINLPQIGQSLLKGKWDCIGLIRDNKIRIGKLEIKNNDNIVFDGFGFSNYEGNLEIKGDDLYIYFRGAKKNSILVANLRYIEEKKISVILGSFITTNVHEKGTVIGTVYLIKELSDFYADSCIGEYSQDTDTYKYYQKKGIVKDLQTIYVKSVIRTE